jgi:hypothetical protein
MEVAIAMNPVRLEARNFDCPKTGTMNSDIDQGLNFESVGVNVNPIQAVGPYPDEAVRRVRTTSAVEHADKKADTTIAHAPKIGDVGRPSARTKAAAFGKVRPCEQRVPESSDLRTVHGTVGIENDQDVPLSGVQPGAHCGTFARCSLVNYPHVGPQCPGDALSVVVRATIDNNDFVDPPRNCI